MTLDETREEIDRWRLKFSAARRVEREGCIGCPFYFAPVFRAAETDNAYCLAEQRELPKAITIPIMAEGEKRSVPFVYPLEGCVMQSRKWKGTESDRGKPDEQ